LLAHIVERGPRIAAPADAPDEVRRTGLLNIADADPVFYGRPTDVLDGDGFLVSRTTHPVTRKHIETMYARIRRHLPWAQQRGLRPHDMRHSSARLVYKASGGDEQMARLHLAHDAASSTDHYLAEQLEALAALKEELFGRDNLDPGAQGNPE